MNDSTSADWQARPGVLLATRYLRTHAIPIELTSLAKLPRLSRRVIRFALRLFPRFLDRVDLAVPIIVAGKGWHEIVLDGRHRLSKATWIGRSELPAVRVPFRFAFELLFPGVYWVEWLGLFLHRTHRKSRARQRGTPA